MLVSWKSVHFARDILPNWKCSASRTTILTSAVNVQTTEDVDSNEVGVFEYWRALQASLHFKIDCCSWMFTIHLYQHVLKIRSNIELLVSLSIGRLSSFTALVLQTSPLIVAPLYNSPTKIRYIKSGSNQIQSSTKVYKIPLLSDLHPMDTLILKRNFLFLLQLLIHSKYCYRSGE